MSTHPFYCSSVVSSCHLLLTLLLLLLLPPQMDAKWLGDEYSKVPGVPKKVRCSNTCLYNLLNHPAAILPTHKLTTCKLQHTLRVER
jgi:hypothetical protein